MKTVAGIGDYVVVKKEGLVESAGGIILNADDKAKVVKGIVQDSASELGNSTDYLSEGDVIFYLGHTAHAIPGYKDTFAVHIDNVLGYEYEES